MFVVSSICDKAKSLATRAATLRRSLIALCFVGLIVTVSAEAQVTIAISPTSVNVTANTTKQFMSIVTGTTNVGVKWFVDGVIGGASSTGTISTTGVYTAPAAASSHTVAATSNADPTQSASSAVTVTQVAVSISPTSVSVAANTTKQFAASVTGTTNTGVKWYVDGVLGGAAATGTITSGGLYTAPAAAGSHAVSIISNADTTKSASSAVTVTTIVVGISPSSASVSVNATKQFAATVTGTTNVGVVWSVDTINGGNSAVGTISTGGLYTAPTAAGTHTVTITSNADPTQSASATVTVTSPSPITISINPASASLTTNTTQQFTATVTGTTNVGVVWSVDGVAGGNSTAGNISASGLYTAPAGAGPHSVKATSNADPTQSASATVTVTAISVSLSPTSASVTANTTKQFIATVTGTTSLGVKWYVDATLGGSSTVGTITTGGLYTAPATGGTHTVSITSNADPTQSASSTVTVSAIAVSLSPTSVSVTENANQQFTATITGTTNVGVRWLVDGVIGGNATVGIISTSGVYTAPAAIGTHTVSFTANADPTQSASATVTVVAPIPITISISPTSATVVGTQTKQFISTVTGSTNLGVKWYVDGILGGTDTAGNISTAGMYQAPNLSASHTVTVVSNADPTKSATSAVTVTGNIWVEMIPFDACTAFGGTQQFTATVAGTTNQIVSWQVDGVTGGSSSLGIINSNGMYTAPSTLGSHIVKAISAASTSKTASVTVSV
jgi:hypothetical protein